MVNSFIRVPLACLGCREQGSRADTLMELSENCLPNLTVKFILSPSSCLGDSWEFHDCSGIAAHVCWDESSQNSLWNFFSDQRSQSVTVSSVQTFSQFPGNKANQGLPSSFLRFGPASPPSFPLSLPLVSPRSGMIIHHCAVPKWRPFSQSGRRESDYSMV